MSDFLKKQFLDFQGLREYDDLLKKYVGELNTENNSALDAEKERAEAAEKDLLDKLLALAGVKNAADLEGLADISKIDGRLTNAEKAINTLNADENTPGSVSKQVKDAINAVVDGADEAFDTLKELQQWITTDGEGVQGLMQQVADLKNKDEAIETEIADLKTDVASDMSDLKDYVDTQDKAVYDSIESIQNIQIHSLFPVAQAGGETAAQAITALKEGEALTLSADQTIATDLVINKDCYIDANGAVFEGTVTVPAGKEVVIENATFKNPVVMA